VALDDGRRVLISPVRPQDCAAERAFVGALSLTSAIVASHFGLREAHGPRSHAQLTEIDPHHPRRVVRAPARSDHLDDQAIVAERWAMLCERQRRRQSLQSPSPTNGKRWHSAGVADAMSPRLAPKGLRAFSRRAVGQQIDIALCAKPWRPAQAQPRRRDRGGAEFR